MLTNEPNLSFFFFANVEQQRAKEKQTLKTAPIEDDKRDLINREIGKFRKTAEADEQKKEKEKEGRKKREERDLERDKARGSTSPRKVNFIDSSDRWSIEMYLRLIMWWKWNVRF